MDGFKEIRKTKEKTIKSDISTYNHLNSKKSLGFLEFPKEDFLRCQVDVEKYAPKKQEVFEPPFSLCRDDLFVCVDEEAKVRLYQIVDLLKEEWLRLSLTVTSLCMEEEKMNFAGIGKIVSYHQLCEEMEKEGIAITMDNENRVTIQEIHKVLAYAKSYFGIEKPKEKVKK